MRTSADMLDAINCIHEKAFIIDGHFDLTSDLLSRRERGERNVIRDHYLDNFRKGDFDAIVSAIFIEDYYLPEMGLRRALGQISSLHDEIRETPGLFRICRTMAEADEAKKADELAIFLSLEGAEPLQNDLQLLSIFYELGVRALGLVWSRRNYVADGCSFIDNARPAAGLTAFGVNVVERAEELGMVLDVSHLADSGFSDLLQVSKKPFIASHSNCRTLASHKRNLTDEQIKALADRGGVVGMNCIVNFITDSEKEPTVEDLVDHVDHIVNLAGCEHVALGFDLCDGFQDYCQTGDATKTSDLLPDHSHLPFFTEALIKRGYTEKDILGFLGGNLRRVYEEICG